jgi:hypothetical protein
MGESGGGLTQILRGVEEVPMSAVSLSVVAVPVRHRFPAAGASGFAKRTGRALVARAVSYPDRFVPRPRQSR